MAKSYSERWQAALSREAAKILPPEAQTDFVAAVKDGDAAVPVLIVLSTFDELSKLITREFPWATESIVAPLEPEIARKLPEHEQGKFYMLDGASVFMAQSFAGLKGQVDYAYDLCAAPGGKTTLLYHFLCPKRIIANELVQKRFARLVANVKRCNLATVECISRDPDQLVAESHGVSDLVVVDAPCSGQALFSKGETSSGAFSKHTIQLNMKRQRRILAAAAQLVRPGGWLCYMTCTYSIPENEKNVDWFCKHFGDFVTEKVPELAGYESGLTDKIAYRLWPQQGAGTGGFAVRFRRVR